MGETLSRLVLANVAHIAAVSVDKPHPGVDSITRSFVAERDGLVIKRPVNRMAQPAFLLQDNAALAAMQVDIDQAAFGLGKIKGAEFTPVGQRPPVAFFYLDADQFAAIAVCHPGTIGDPVVIHCVNHLLFPRRQIHAAQLPIVFHIPQRAVVVG